MFGGKKRDSGWGAEKELGKNAVLLRTFASVFVSSLLPETMASPGKDNYRMKSYKNNALNPEEMRRRREEEGIQLRKQKREQQVR